MKNYFKKLVCLFVITLLSGSLFAATSDSITRLQSIVGRFETKIVKEYERTKELPRQKINKFAKKQVNEILDKYKNNVDNIWNNQSGFEAFLGQDFIFELSNGNRVQLQNPYYTTFLGTFFRSDLYRKSSKEFKQKSFYKMLDFMRDSPLSRKMLLRMTFRYFNNEADYAPLCGSKIVYTINDKRVDFFRTYPMKYILLLEFVNDGPKYIDYGMERTLIKLADKCSGFNHKKLPEFLALIMAAKYGDQKYLDKLIKIVKKVDNSNEGIQKATYIFPYLALVQKKEMVEVLKKILEDQKIIDQGDDIMFRYKGLSSFAAYSLFTMIDGFYKFDAFKFNDAERKKCLEWFKKNPNYKFRKVNFSSKDPIISRVRYMVFENGL